MEDVKSFIAGSASGVVQVVSGHPLDTIKVYLQNGRSRKNLYNFSNLYRGISYPLVTNTLIVSSQFGVYDYLKKEGHCSTRSAIGAGICTGLISTPIDLFKIRKQTFAKNLYQKPFSGLLPTLYREIPANIIYFNVYYSLKDYTSIPIAGAITGVLSWLFTFPIDVIKTRIQTDPTETFLSAYKKGNLFVGITPCLVRALLVNSVGFYAYEMIMASDLKEIEK